MPATGINYYWIVRGENRARRGADPGAFTNNNGSNGTANVNALRPGVVSQDKCLSWGSDGDGIRRQHDNNPLLFNYRLLSGNPIAGRDDDAGGRRRAKMRTHGSRRIRLVTGQEGGRPVERRRGRADYPNWGARREKARK